MIFISHCLAIAQECWYDQSEPAPNERANHEQRERSLCACVLSSPVIIYLQNDTGVRYEWYANGRNGVFEEGGGKPHGITQAVPDELKLGGKLAR